MKLAAATLSLLALVSHCTIVVVQSATCGGGSRGDGTCPQSGLCCSQYGWCGVGSTYCNGGGSGSGTCGNGQRGNGICPQAGLCCSQFGWCGEGSAFCTGPTTPVQPTPPPSRRPQPTNVVAPTPSPLPRPSSSTNRMIAYLGNWQSCPSATQLAQYTHVVVAFAVTYTWAPGKNSCSSTCDIATPPICNNNANPSLLNDLRSQGKKIIMSFGGAGMGGSWDGDENDCWEYCYGKETQVVDRLVQIVAELDADGVDIDYEYFYEDNQNGSGFTKGAAAQNFLRLVTQGLRAALPPDAIVTHAPMDVDLVPTSAYFQLLKANANALDFIMPQYYNGVTRPAVDGIDGTGTGRQSALDHYTEVANQFFGGDATRIVFGFCISDCSATGSNANANQAAQVMRDLANSYNCHGGAFFWVAQHDTGGSWSSVVNQAMAESSDCPTSPVAPVPAAPVPAAPVPVATSPTTPVTASPVSVSGQPCCPSGYTGLVAFAACTKFYHCNNGAVAGSPIDCPAGLLFDDNLDTCNWAAQVTCSGNAPC